MLNILKAEIMFILFSVVSLTTKCTMNVNFNYLL